MPTLNIPHVPQNGETHCGVACLEMVYRYFDITDITQDDIWDKRKTIRPDGTAPFMTTQNMVDDLVEKGFQVLSGQFYLETEECASSIASLLEAGTPIIACKQWDEPKYGHFVVIVGIEKDKILYLDPEKESAQEKDIETFLKEWQATGEEVIGGEFIVMGKGEIELQIKNLHLTNFFAPKLLKFTLENVNFLP